VLAPHDLELPLEDVELPLPPDESHVAEDNRESAHR
jgi:hypothetical protein